jgi:hypothetical protein
LPDGNKVGIPIETVALLKKLERQARLAQTEIKGHMKVEDELKARIIELEREMKLVPTVEAGILCPDAAEVECIARQLATNGFKGFADEVRKLWVEFDQAQARIAELEKDAARYRWLREHQKPYLGYTPGVQLALQHLWNSGYYLDKLDAAIDAALKDRA